MCNCPLALLPPLHLTEIDGPSSSGPFIWASRQSQWNSRKGPGPVASLQRARRSQIYRTSWEWLYLWTEKWEQKSQNEDGEEERESILFFLTFLSLPVNPTLSAPLSPHSSPLSAFSIPFQSPSEHSENASSYYFTYAVHQSDRVRITPSMTPKSRRYRSLGLHGIAVTTSGSPGWDREPLGKPDWVKPFSVQPSVI